MSGVTSSSVSGSSVTLSKPAGRVILPSRRSLSLSSIGHEAASLPRSTFGTAARALATAVCGCAAGSAVSTGTAGSIDEIGSVDGPYSRGVAGVAGSDRVAAVAGVAGAASPCAGRAGSSTGNRDIAPATASPSSCSASTRSASSCCSSPSGVGIKPDSGEVGINLKGSVSSPSPVLPNL